MLETAPCSLCHPLPLRPPQALYLQLLQNTLRVLYCVVPADGGSGRVLAVSPGEACFEGLHLVPAPPVVAPLLSAHTDRLHAHHPHHAHQSQLACLVAVPLGWLLLLGPLAVVRRLWRHRRAGTLFSDVFRRDFGFFLLHARPQFWSGTPLPPRATHRHPDPLRPFHFAALELTFAARLARTQYRVPQ